MYEPGVYTPRMITEAEIHEQSELDVRCDMTASVCVTSVMTDLIGVDYRLHHRDGSNCITTTP